MNEIIQTLRKGSIVVYENSTVFKRDKVVLRVDEVDEEEDVWVKITDRNIIKDEMQGCVGSDGLFCVGGMDGFIHGGGRGKNHAYLRFAKIEEEEDVMN